MCKAAKTKELQTDKQKFLFLITLTVFFIMMTALPIKAAELTTQDQTISSEELSLTHIQTTIQKQLKAISSRNAELAFSMISEKMHRKFSTPQEFLGKIRFEYRPIYNYETFEFLDHHDLNGDLLQKVSITDRYGEEAIALYRLKKDTQGSWLIDSFSLLYTDGQAI